MARVSSTWAAILTEELLHNSYSVLDGRDERLLDWIEHSGISVLIADNFAVEGFPYEDGAEGGHYHGLPIHQRCLVDLGIHLGEIWYLTPLARYWPGRTFAVPAHRAAASPARLLRVADDPGCDGLNRGRGTNVASIKTNETVAGRIAAGFARHGLTVAFGQSIPTAFHLAAPHIGISQAVYRTENAGGAMADAYARISNRISVVTAQNGPAATLLVPPLAEALKASVPVVALVQDVPRSQADKNAFQEIDHFRLFDPVAKWVRRIDDPARIDEYVDMAVTVATSGRPGPAVLLVPFDVLNLPAPASISRKAGLGGFPLDRVVADPARLARQRNCSPRRARRSSSPAAASTCPSDRGALRSCRSGARCPSRQP